MQGKLQALNSAYDKHQGLQSGERPSPTPDLSSRQERWNMLQIAQSLAFDLSCLLNSEHNE